MLSLLDIAERAAKGPKIDENKWNMDLFTTLGALTKKYRIAYPEDGSFFNMDDELADRVFEAALEFLTEKGAFCLSTGRTIQFTRSEILETIQAIPAELVVGRGTDSRVLRKRCIEEKEGINHCPGHHAPWSEELAPLAIKNHAQIPSADYLEGINFTHVDGREIRGVSMEAYAARRGVAWLREGIRKAGRPGMAIACYPINTRAAALLAPLDEECGIRSTDGILLSVLPDVKIEQDLIAAAVVYNEHGCFAVNSGGGGFVGGFAGGLESAIIEGVIKPLVGFLVYRDNITYAGVGALHATKGGEIMGLNPRGCWATSVVCQALNRNTNFIYFGGKAGTGGDPGSGTETRLWSLVGHVATPVNGGNVGIARVGRATVDSSQTPLEQTWGYEAAVAAMRSGFDRGSASDFLRKLDEKIRGKVTEPAKHISQCWDLTKGRPLPDYEDMYARVKEEVSGMGLSFR
ncbi:MAG: monomethylamine:corrinoid methyltransferase [Sedimentisphaerales bacterium]|nr:monomethylamine:corrinoid methyltransferase [Sedimentisphaerales bacterium]